jgi:hypothetical protein
MMTTELIGRKFWKPGDRQHVWVVDAVVPTAKGRPTFVVLVSQEGDMAEDVDLSHLEDPEQYTPVT